MTDTGAPEASWIAADWGTTHLRAWAMAPDGEVLDQAQSSDGMGALDPEGFEPALLSLIGDWMNDAALMPVLACGMVGARQGWIEAPYSETPCPPLAAARFVQAPTKDPRLDVRLLPGLSQADPPDVMRGEETQLAGFLSQTPDFDGVICLPGTHTKWVSLAGGRVNHFRTFMTGEMFGLLAQHSVLRLTLGAGWDDDAFRDGVARGLDQPAELGAHLFALRAGALLDGLPPDAARAMLSGLLIGAELAGQTDLTAAQGVVVLGGDAVAAPYVTALRYAGYAPERVDADQAVLSGLRAAHALLTGD